MIRPTTFLASERLNRAVGAKIEIASETFQHTGSFKFRGAWHMASNVPNRHLLASSSGNFGQALAFACQQLNKRCTIVMPDDSVAVKVQAVRDFGGNVDLVDVRSISREDRVEALAMDDPDVYLASGFDSDLMIQGNSSLGRELACKSDSVDCVVAPVSGGGLAAGIFTGLGASNSALPLIGAEPLMANHVTRSLRSGRLIKDAHEPRTIADGARTTSLGNRNWEILRNGLRDCVEVPEQTIRDAVRMLFHLVNLKVEPTGALSLAAVLVRPDLFEGRRVCCVVSGGNVDPSLYAELIN